MADLTEYQQRVVRLRFAHVCEAETGFRSGDPLRPEPGEPRAAYDPARTLLRDRLLAKVAELSALSGPDAALLGVGQVSVRTLERWIAQCRRAGVLGCADGRWLRRSGAHATVSEAVREALFAVHAETLHRSRLSMRTRERLIHQYVRERFGAEVPVPSYWTLRRVWQQWFGAGGARQRYQRSAAAAPPSGAHVVVHRPGQLVALDTTVLPVKVREQVFDEPVSAHLTIALDVFTHSMVAFRLTLISDTSVDVAMLLREVMMPSRMREGWGEDMRWAYPGVPASVADELAGYPVAAVPFFTPETVTTDHGSVYKNHHLVEVQRATGVNILPARVLRPTDKHAVERAFAAAQSLLFELLLGYQGVDVADRGSDPERDTTLTLAGMEQLVATWIVKIWQRRVLGDCAPCWDPGGTHSPNSLFAVAIAQGGFALQVPDPDLYYGLLPASHVKIHGRRGVKVRGLWYDGSVLDPFRGQRSTRGGVHAGSWVIRYDKRDPRSVFFQHPDTGGWHRLAWVGMPADGVLPAFGDARREELLQAVADAGLAPRSDAELQSVLLDLLGAAIPVEQWPTQLSTQQRRRHAREVAQAAAATGDVPAETAQPAATPQGSAADPQAHAGAGQRARQVADAVDAERQRRREKAVPDTPAAPARLGAGLRRHSRLLVPAKEQP
jgi:hypothetical protein